MIATNRTQKAVTMMMILTMSFTMGYGQGMLIEGASKLFQSLKQKETASEFMVITADFSVDAAEEKDSFNINAVLNVLDRKQQQSDNNTVIASFTVKNIDVTYEAELETESWMETSLTEEIETVPALESWMTESLTNDVEVAPAVESWMTESLVSDHEGSIEVESWMTTPLGENFEANIVTEEWMTTPLYASQESAITLESWMTQPLR